MFVDLHIAFLALGQSVLLAVQPARCASVVSRPLLASGNLQRGGVLSTIIILSLFHLLAAGFYFLNWLMKNGHNGGHLCVTNCP
jgi:hypothetical protein